MTKRDGGTGAGKLGSLAGRGRALNRLATMGSHSHLQEQERKPIGHLCNMEQATCLKLKPEKDRSRREQSLQGSLSSPVITRKGQEWAWQ